MGFRMYSFFGAFLVVIAACSSGAPAHSNPPAPPPPSVQIIISSPVDGASVSENSITIMGAVAPANANVDLTVNGVLQVLDGQGGFEAVLRLREGGNLIEVEVTDRVSGAQAASNTILINFTPLDFSAVARAVDAFEIADMAVMIGDVDGILFSHVKGGFALDASYRSASATKLVTGLTIWRLIEDGTLARDSRPQDFIDFWTDLSGDPRADVTLDQLIGFTSGFNASPGNAGCIGDRISTIEDCVREIYDDMQDSMPGQEYYYGPEHMQIAALMAQEATGEAFQSLQRRILFDLAGVSANTGYNPLQGDNPRYSGALVTTVNDYALLLQGILSGEFVTDLDGFLEDRTASAFFGFRPEALSDNMLDWHYGFGFWKECDGPSYTDECDDAPIISSPGARGWTPWIDFESGYWAIIALDEQRRAGFRPASVSVGLEQELQILIEDALDANRLH